MTINPDSTRETRESHPLFRKIRLEGEKRELPLLRSAIRELAFDKIVVRDRQIWAEGKLQQEGVDLTADDRGYHRQRTGMRICVLVRTGWSPAA